MNHIIGLMPSARGVWRVVYCADALPEDPLVYSAHGILEVLSPVTYFKDALVDLPVVLGHQFAPQVHR